MQDSHKKLLKAGLINGSLWTCVLLVFTYFKNGLININYMPLWFMFFAGTGALRHYYFNKKSKE